MDRKVLVLDDTENMFYQLRQTNSVLAQAYLESPQHVVEYFKNLHGFNVVFRRFAPSWLLEQGLSPRFLDLIEPIRGKNAVDIRMVIYVLTKAHLAVTAHLVILSADSDFSPLIQHLAKYPHITVTQYNILPQGLKKRLRQATPQAIMPSFLEEHLAKQGGKVSLTTLRIELDRYAVNKWQGTGSFLKWLLNLKLDQRFTLDLAKQTLALSDFNPQICQTIAEVPEQQEPSA